MGALTTISHSRFVRVLQEGLVNCNALANGWLWSNVITGEAQASVKQVHERQWGVGGAGVSRDK